jgi:hypothetical protein
MWKSGTKDLALSINNELALPIDNGLGVWNMISGDNECREYLRVKRVSSCGTF